MDFLQDIARTARSMPPPSHPQLATPDLYDYIDGATEKDGTVYKADFAIVGSGAGGGSLAYFLTELGFKVVLIEAGSAFHTADFSQDLGKAYQDLYADFGTLTTDRPPILPIFWAEGLGGSTLVNSGLCFRPRAEVLDDWRAQSGVDWFSLAGLEEEYSWVEDYMMVGPGKEEALGRHNTLLREASEKLGWRGGNAPRNGPGCIGCGACNTGCPSGGKRSVDTSFIRDAAGQGLKVVTRARVREITRDRTGAVQSVSGHFVAADKKPRKASFRVEAEAFVLAAGAATTPLLLQRNGFKNPHIGLHLHGHPGAGVNAWFYHELVRQWDGITQGWYVDEFSEEGILIETASVQAAAISSAFAPNGAAGQAYMKDFRHIATAGGMVHDTGTGSVRLGFGGRPVRKYCPSGQDVKKLKRTMMLIGELFMAAGAARLQPSVYGAEPVENLRDLEALLSTVHDPGRFVLYISHPHGTCRMHTDPREGVVAPDFRTHESPNLFICDGSVFSDTLGVNPQITIMAFSRRLSKIIAAHA